MLKYFRLKVYVFQKSLEIQTQACVCETAYRCKASVVLEERAPSAGYHCAILHLLVPPLHVLNGALPLTDQLLPLSMCVAEVLCSSVQSNLFHNNSAAALSQCLMFYAQNVSQMHKMNKYTNNSNVCK